MTQSIPKISTPIPIGFKRNSDGTYSHQSGIVRVTVLKDTRTKRKSMINRAETEIRVTTRRVNWRASSSGEVTSHTPPSVRIKIQTTYGPGVKQSSPSRYGKGKILRDHEGHHGTDLLRYISEHPITFTGKVGMAEADFEEAVHQLHRDAEDLKQKAEEESIKATDCSTSIKADFCVVDDE